MLHQEQGFRLKSRQCVGHRDFQIFGGAILLWLSTWGLLFPCLIPSLVPWFFNTRCIPLTSAPLLPAVLSPLVPGTSWGTVFCAAKRAKNCINIGRDPIHSSLDPNSWWLWGVNFLHKRHNCLCPHVSPSCHLLLAHVTFSGQPYLPAQQTCLCHMQHLPLGVSLSNRMKVGESPTLWCLGTLWCWTFHKPLSRAMGDGLFLCERCICCYRYLLKPEIHPKLYSTVGSQYNWTGKGLISSWPNKDHAFRNNEEKVEFFMDGPSQ